MKIKLMAVLVAGLAIVPVMAFAQSNSSISALIEQIARLQEQVAELRRKIPSSGENMPVPTPVPPSEEGVGFCYTFAKNLQMGMKSKDVDALQTVLRMQGFAISPAELDTAEYGETTAAAVVSFQMKYEIKPASGYVGPLTRAKLNAMYSCGNQARSLTLLSPNGGETWQKGGIQKIAWRDAEGLEICPPVPVPTEGGSTADIFMPCTSKFTYKLSLDPVDYKCDTVPCGTGPNLVIADGVSGYSYAWPVGKTSGGELAEGAYRLVVCRKSGGACDSSDSYFKISNGSPAMTSLQVTSPRGGEVWQAGKTYTISWQTPTIYCVQAPCPQPKAPAAVNIYLGESIIAKKVPSGLSSGSYSWTVPTSQAPGIYRISVSDYENISNYGQSGSFQIQGGATEGRPQVVTPNGGETWKKGSLQTIRWNDAMPAVPTCPAGGYCPPPPLPFGYDINLVYATPSCDLPGTVCAPMPTPMRIANGVKGYSYSWTVGQNIDGRAITSNAYYIQICRAGTSICDSSNDYFKIDAGNVDVRQVRVHSPNGGESFVSGKPFNVMWEWAYSPAKPMLYVYSPVLGNIYSMSLSGLSGKYGVEINPTLNGSPLAAGEYKITICDEGTDRTDVPGKPVCDSSDGYFRLTAASSRSLGLSLDPSSPASGTELPKGGKNVKLMTVRLAAGGGDAEVSQLSICLATSIPSGLQEFSNFRLMDMNGVQLGSLSRLMNSDTSRGCMWGSLNFMSTVIAMGSQKTLTLVADIASGASDQIIAPSIIGVAGNNLPPVQGLDLRGNKLVISSGSTATSTPMAVTVASPNGGETINQGSAYRIAWSGGKNKVQIGLVPAGTVKTAPPSILGWITVSGAPNGSFYWNGEKTCDLMMSTCTSVAPGKYKVIAVSEDANTNYVLWDHILNLPGNWDVSDEPFAIVRGIALPVINSISPSSGPVGTTVLLTGTGFSSSENTINGIGASASFQVNAYSPDGKTLKFAIPGYEMLDGRPLPAGVYEIEVGTAGGSSNRVKLNVTTSSSGAPVISGITAPASLLVGQQGTWTIRATDPNNGSLNYSVDWGEYVSGSATGSGTGGGSIAVGQSATFTHSYSMPGTYTPKFMVMNAQGQSVSTSASVHVVSDAKPDLVIDDIYYEEPYIKVRYRNAGTGASTGTFLIKLQGKAIEYPGNSLYRFTVPAPGQSAVTGGFTPGLVGLQPGMSSLVAAVIDWEGRVGESNEANNTLSRTISIPGSTTSGPATYSGSETDMANVIVSAQELMDRILNFLRSQQ